MEERQMIGQSSYETQIMKYNFLIWITLWGWSILVSLLCVRGCIFKENFGLFNWTNGGNNQ